MKLVSALLLLAMLAQAAELETEKFLAAEPEKEKKAPAEPEKEPAAHDDSYQKVVGSEAGQESSYQDTHASLPECPPWFTIPHECNFIGARSGFCYNPAMTAMDQDNMWTCLTGNDLGPNFPCPKDQPIKCNFVGTNHGAANKFLVLALICPAGVICALSRLGMVENKQVQQGRMGPILA